MTKISADSTMIVKKVLPALVFGVAAAIIAVSFTRSVQFERTLMLVIGCGQMVGTIRLLMMNSKLVDEVHDCGSFLSIHNGGRKWEVPFANIAKVTGSEKRVRITLSPAGQDGQGGLGPEVDFLTAQPTAFTGLALRADEARVNLVS